VTAAAPVKVLGEEELEPELRHFLRVKQRGCNRRRRAVVDVTGRGELVADMPAASVVFAERNAHRWKEKRYSAEGPVVGAGSVRVTPTVDGPARS